MSASVFRLLDDKSKVVEMRLKTVEEFKARKQSTDSS